MKCSIHLGEVPVKDFNEKKGICKACEKANMKSFEEEFPELKNALSISHDDNRYYCPEAIQEHCLSKQRVKEVIDKYIVEKTEGIRFGKPINPMKLKKELGLED